MINQIAQILVKFELTYYFTTADGHQRYHSIALAFFAQIKNIMIVAVIHFQALI
jgi:hypothetical protein